MSFEKAFGEIFAELFKQRAQKPLIKPNGKRWVCKTPDGRTGHGVTPAQAFGAWKAVRQ
jgi:hypothetical protein